MGELKVGDIVARKSYGYDVFFKVVDIKNGTGEKTFTLKGITYRIEADAPESDLVLQPRQKIEEYTRRLDRLIEKKTRELCSSRQLSSLRGAEKKFRFRSTPNDEAQKFEKPGKVLHIDGDNDYLQACMEEYSKLGMEAVGKHVSEAEQPLKILGLLQVYRPDILVLTGHDGMIKGKGDYLNPINYRNSKYFIDAVKEARKFDGDMDSLVIFAGACQSMFNEIIKAGANYASAPFRVLIHALDPVLICHTLAFTSVEKVVPPQDVINNTITGVKGIGGLETRGKYRDGFPLEPYDA